jgi:vitamin B12 transporter
MTYQKNLMIPALTQIALLCSPIAFAKPENDTLDPIVVTASFGKLSQSSLGTTTTILPQKTLEALGNPSVTDFLRMTPSLSVSTSGAIGTQTQVRIRGSEANHTIVFVDGIKANDPAAGGEYGFSESLSSGISRIEILRGSQSAMYGSEAIGGVISIFTRAPFDTGSKIFADVSGGSFGTIQANGGGSWNDGVLGLSLAAGLHRTDGINISPEGNEKDGSQTITLLGKAEARPNDTTRFSFSARYVEQRSDYDDTQFSDPAAPYVVDTLNLKQKSKRFYARGFAEFGSDAWTHLLETSIVSTRNAQRDGIAANNTDRNGGRVTLGYRTSATVDTGNVSHNLTAAVLHERETYQDQSSAYGGGSRQDKSRTQTSVVGQYRLGVSDKFFADASVRNDWNSGFADATTWRLSGSAQIGAGFRLHASAGRGITNPTFTEQFGFFPDSFKGNENLRPEQSTGWDGGVEWRNDWLRVDATYFSARLKSEISTEFDENFVAFPVNENGISKRSGIELSLDARKNAFTLMAFYSYLQATEQNSTGTPRTVEIRRPKHQGALTLMWAQDAISVATSVSYTGKRLDDDFRRYPSVSLELPAYTLATVLGQYQLNEKIAVFARVENAFNAKYQDVFGYRTAGLGAYGGLKLRLD